MPILFYNLDIIERNFSSQPKRSYTLKMNGHTDYQDVYKFVQTMMKYILVKVKNYE